MQTATVREKLHRMHQEYLDDANTKPCAKPLEEDAEKILTIRKKLASLEKECYVRLRDRKDVTATDRKIAKRKERFTVYCCQKQR